MTKLLISLPAFIFGLLIALFVPVSIIAAGAGGVVSLDLSPASGFTGDKVIVSGQNAPDQPLTVTIAPQSSPSTSFQLVSYVQPKSDGSWDAQIYIPRQWPGYTVTPGKYLVTVANADGSYTAQGILTVQPSPTAGVSPVPTKASAGGNILTQLGQHNAFIPVVGLILLLGLLVLLVNYLGKPKT
jgi:hypothetical protein